MSRRRDARGGQALVELAITILTMIGLSAGVIEFGRMFMIANMVTHATSDGARAAAITPKASRDSAGTISNIAPIRTLVQNEISNVAAGIFTVTVAQALSGGIPIVTVATTATVPYIILPGLRGQSLTINRAITFRDEGRS